MVWGALEVPRKLWNACQWCGEARRYIGSCEMCVLCKGALQAHGELWGAC